MFVRTLDPKEVFDTSRQAKKGEDHPEALAQGKCDKAGDECLHWHPGSTYIGILTQLKEYELHDQQLQVYLNFLACFIKPEHLGVDKTAARLVKLDVSNSAIHLKQ